MTTEQKTKMLEMASAQSKQLARLVDDLLVTSQLQAHRLSLQIEPADLEQTVREALEAAEVKRRHHRLELYVEPIECAIDAARVGQIVRNLVENAYKYTPDRSRVSVAAKTEAGGIVIAVSDTGQGIPEDKRDELFEAFARIEETSAGREGVGLGLYVVSQLVTAMDGRIDLASSSRGTTFTIHLPCEVTGRPVLGLVRHDDEVGGSGTP